MERGTEWEREAVRRRWTDLERTRRAATRLRAGLFLVFSGVTLLLVALATEACIHVGPWFHGCTEVVSRTVAVGLGLLVPAAVGSGLWLCWTALRE